MNTEDFAKLLYDEIKSLRSDIADIKKEMTTLKVKVAIFGSLAGSIATFVVNKFFH